MRPQYLRFAAGLVSLMVTEAEGRCPISTSVSPLRLLTLSSYEVEITDGGPGDLDEAVDGHCDLALTTCIGMPACAPEPLERLRVSVRGKPSNGSRRDLEAALLEGFAHIPGANRVHKGIDLTAAGPAPEMCAETRIGLSTGSRRHHSVKVAVTARGSRDTTSASVKVRCIASHIGGSGQPTCVNTRGAWCPIPADEPGAPPPGVPVVTTTTITPPSASPTTTTLPPNARTYYISPDGRDANRGTSRAAPLRSFDRAIHRLEPGDVLVVLDGTYTRENTGLPRIHCGSNAASGTASRPIVIRAENERRAFLSSDGYQAGFAMDDCRWWHVEGLRAASTDNATGEQTDGYPFRFRGVHNVTLRRLFGSHNNRTQNTHVYAIENSRNVLVEECEAYFFHRHAFSLWKSYGITLRRCYANSMRYGEHDCCSDIDNRDFGDEAYSIYGTSASILENCVSENEANGFQIHGIENDLDPSGHGGRNNRILGSISLDDSVAGLVSSRFSGGKYRNALGNVFRDFVAARPLGHGLFLRGAAGTLVENVTLYGSRQNSGLVADAGAEQLGGTCGPANPEGCGFTARNVLALNNAAHGVVAEEQHPWHVGHSNASGSSVNWDIGEDIGDRFGHVRQSLQVDPGAIGLGARRCLLWIPAASRMKRAGRDGQDIGANVVYRYEDGTLTSTPLWDAESGAFPCGAIVPGINDGERSCATLHRRLNVNTNGCPLPPLTSPP